MSLHKHIFKVGAWTGVSRILGFVRDMIIAAVLGAGRLSDIFLAAFKLPNLFRDLLGEGALAAVFIPMFSAHKNRQKIGPFVASNVFSWLMALLLAITIVAEIAMPIIIWAIAPGFADDPGKMQLTVIIARIMFVYVILVCGVAFLSSILNAFSEFAVAAAMPALLNVFMIGGLVAAKHFGAGTTGLYILSIAVVLCGLTQIAILWGRLRARRFGLRIIRPRMTDGVRTIIRRLGTSILGSGFYQLNVLAGTFIASFQAGAVSWLYYADRMVQLPFAIIGLAAGTVLLTSISDAITAKNMNAVYKQQNAAMRQSMLFTLPCTAGLFVLAVPIMQFVFERGAWTHESTLATGAAIMILCLTLPAMTTSQVYTKTLYAAQDVKTPVRIGAICIGGSVILMFAIVGFVGYLAYPIATVVSGYSRNILLRNVCRKRGLFRPLPATRRAIFAFGALSVIIGGGLWAAMRAGAITGIFTLAAAIAIAGIVYLPVAWMVNKKCK